MRHSANHGNASPSAPWTPWKQRLAGRRLTLALVLLCTLAGWGIWHGLALSGFNAAQWSDPSLHWHAAQRADDRSDSAPAVRLITRHAVIAGAVRDGSLLRHAALLLDDRMMHCLNDALNRLGAPQRDVSAHPPFWISFESGLPAAGGTLPPMSASGWRPRVLIDRVAWQHLITDQARRNLLAHELTHALLMTRLPHVLPRWFEEGLAVRLGQQCGGPALAPVQQMLTTPRHAPVYWPSERATAAQYGASASFTSWMLDRLPMHARPLDPARFPDGPTLAALAAALDPPQRPGDALAQWGAALLIGDPAHPRFNWPDDMPLAGRPALQALPAHVGLSAGEVLLLGAIEGPALVIIDETPMDEEATAQTARDDGACVDSLADSLHAAPAIQSECSAAHRSTAMQWFAWSVSWRADDSPIVAPVLTGTSWGVWTVPAQTASALALAVWADDSAMTGRIRIRIVDGHAQNQAP